jgi:hypothetical protein
MNTEYWVACSCWRIKSTAASYIMASGSATSSYCILDEHSFE